MSPKSLLRNKEAVSTLEDLSAGQFNKIISDTANLKPELVRRVVVCSGKVYYELNNQRTEKKIIRYCNSSCGATLSFPAIRAGGAIKNL